MGTRLNAVLGLTLSFAAAAQADSLFERQRVRLLDAFSGSEFLYFDKADRQTLVGELVRGIEANYALLSLKKNTIGLDFAAQAKAAVETEGAVEDVEGPDAQAAANLAFLDRVRAFVAVFQDTHFGIRARNPLAPVALGVDFMKVGGKFVVSGRTLKLLAHSAARADDKAFTEIQLGDELVQIEGQNPAEHFRQFEPYVFASSPGYREMRAVAAMSLRSFKLPAKGYALVALKNAKGEVRTYRMPWFYRNVTRSDEARYLALRGFTKSDELALSWDAEKHAWTRGGLDAQNYTMAHSMKNLVGAKLFLSVDDGEHADQSGTPVMRTGYVLRDGRAYGVFQLFSFYADKLSADGGRTKVAYMDPIRAFVKELAAQNVPMIFDLRTNGGGHGAYPAQLLSILAPPNESYASPTWALPITRYVRQIYDDEATLPETFPGLLPGVSADMLANLVRQAVAAKQTLTAAYSSEDVKADAEVGGYKGKVVALIAPSCISACDIMSMLLKASGRATLVGQPANGTGAGFRTNDQFNTGWSDSYRVFETTFPNVLFGRPAKAGEHVFPGQAAELNGENRSVVPDVEYRSTVEDIRTGDAGWLNQAIEILNQ